MKFPEKVAIGLIIAVILFPPWSLNLGNGFFVTEWAFIGAGPDGNGLPSIDVMLLLVELGIVGIVYFLLSRTQGK
jgi:hypothetical protein